MTDMTSEPLSKRLSHRVAIRFAHFERHYELCSPYIHSFRDIDCRDWYREFSDRVFNSVGTGRHLPIVRLGHGEFIMAVGYQVPHGVSFRSWLIHYYVLLKRRLGLAPAFFSGSPDSTACTYSRDEIVRVRAMYTEGLREVAKVGIVAAAFNDNPGYRQYLSKYQAWMDREQIPLHYDNYASVYAPYALLLGPEGKALLRGRHLLFVSCFSREKELSLRLALEQLGVASAQFYPVSPTKAMFDVVDLNQVRRPVDIAFVSAGVGKFGLMQQLKPLGVVVIDAGFVIDALAYPEKRWNRPFCVPDSEFDIEKIKFIEKSDIGMLRAVNAAQGRTPPLLDELEAIIRARG